MKRYVGKFARAVLEKGRELNAAPFARVWADAIDLLAPASEWGRSLPNAKTARANALEAAWVRWKAATGLRERRDALSKLMAAAAWMALSVMKEQHETN